MVFVDEIYICGKCGMEIKIIKEGIGPLTCCKQPMHEKQDNKEEQPWTEG